MTGEQMSRGAFQEWYVVCWSFERELSLMLGESGVAEIP